MGQRVGPGASGAVEHQAAVAAGGGVDAVAQYRVVVDIGGGDLSGGGQAAVFGDGAGLYRRRDHRRVVGAQHGDGDGLRGGRPFVVGAGDGEAVGQAVVGR